MQQQEIDEMMARWFIGKTSEQEKEFLLSMKFLKTHIRGIFIHISATAKGIKATDRHYKKIGDD